MRADLAVLPSAAALADVAAERFVAAARDAIDSRGQFLVALSGGSTPRDTYLRLGTEALVSQVMWSRVQVLWTDERCVPPNHAESNYRMARETLLDRVPVPAANVHRIHGEDDPLSAADVADHLDAGGHQCRGRGLVPRLRRRQGGRSPSSARGSPPSGGVAGAGDRTVQWPRTLVRGCSGGR